MPKSEQHQKSKQQIIGRVRSAYEFIKANQDQFSVQMMCRVLEVAPSGYYDWVLQPISNRTHEDARLLRLIRASFVASHGTYALLASISICAKRERPAATSVARLMRLYMAVVMALFSRMIVGWATQTDHSPRARAQCPINGRTSTTATRADSLGSENSIRHRRATPILPLESSRTRFFTE